MADPNNPNDASPNEEPETTPDATDLGEEQLSDADLDNAAGGGYVRYC